MTGATADRTLVIAVPLASGRSSVTVQIDGPGRYDFGFWTGDIAVAGEGVPVHRRGSA